MSFRTVIATLLALTSAAAAEGDLTLTPSCAEIDVTRDTLSEAERATARKQLDRILQQLDLLVVDAGCVDHYVLSHERDGNDTIVRITGPAGIRRGRNPSNRLAAYEKLVIALLDAQTEAIEKAKEEAAAAEDAARDAKAALEVQAAGDGVVATPASDDTSTDAASVDQTYQPTENVDVGATEEEPSRVRTDWLFYGQFMAGSAGTGIGLGVRIPITTGFALDFGFQHAEGDQTAMSAWGVKLLTYQHAEASSSTYFGGGISGGEHRTRMYEGPYSADETQDGMRFDAVAGYMFNRTGSTRLFLQADASVPVFDASPTIMASAGLGF